MASGSTSTPTALVDGTFGDFPLKAQIGDAKAERITSDELEDWFPLPSPDGKWRVFLSFPRGTPAHNVKTDIQLRMIPVPQDPAGKGAPGSIQVLAQIFWWAGHHQRQLVVA